MFGGVSCVGQPQLQDPTLLYCRSTNVTSAIVQGLQLNFDGNQICIADATVGPEDLHAAAQVVVLA